MKKVLIVANEASYVYTLRLELITSLLEQGYCVVISAKASPEVSILERMGCRFVPVEYDRHGMNFLDEIKLIRYYRNLMRQVAPDVVLTFTIKPNVYAGMVCASCNIPYLVSITGLGNALLNDSLMQTVALTLYRIGTRKAKTVFFQNTANRDFMLKHHIAVGRAKLLAGSGVNLEKHCFEPYPEEKEQLTFLTIGRIMREKGTDELLAAAREIKKAFPNVTFQLIGDYDGDFQDQVEAAVADGIVEYLGHQNDIHSFIKRSHAVIHASYHEGMSNVLLESAAAGRPVIATDVPGCRETFIPNVSGISCKAKSAEDLTRAIREFIDLPHEKKAAMGHAGRQKAVREFDRKVIVASYIEEIKNASGDNTYVSV